MNARLHILILFFCLLLAAAAVGQEGYYVVTANRLNVRTGPGMNYPSAGVLNMGEIVEVEQTGGGWAVIQVNGQRRYVSSQYLRFDHAKPQPAQKKTSAQHHRIWDVLYSITKVILGICGVIFILGIFSGSGNFGGISFLILIICGIGSLVGDWLWDDSTIGTVLGMGVVILIAMLLIMPSLSFSWSFSFSSLGRFTYILWATVSLPFYFLDLLQFWLAKPWRPFMKRNLLPNKSKPGMRVFLRIMQIPFYILLFPLRLVNAVYYNMIIHNLYEWSNYTLEVLLPSDDDEGAEGIGSWLVYLPFRIGKYWLFHGLLTILESLIWTVIDVFVPAVTLYHGTQLESADSMLCEPNRNRQRKVESGWLSGIWNVGTGNYAGDGIYFGILRKTLRNYQNGSAIIARVTMGKTIDTVLMPDEVYRQAGHPNAKAVSNWALNNGYTSGEWWRSDPYTHWWEICLYDRQNRYNDSWRIRPIYAIHSYSGLMQRIPGGSAHWFFRGLILNDLWNSLTKLMK